MLNVRNWRPKFNTSLTLPDYCPTAFVLIVAPFELAEPVVGYVDYCLQSFDLTIAPFKQAGPIIAQHKAVIIMEASFKGFKEALIMVACTTTG